MAGGTITGNTYISGHYWLELVWTDSIVNSTTSSVTVKTYFCSDWSASFTSSKNGNTTVNGSSLDWTSNTDVSHSNGSVQKTLVYTRSGVSVTHNADGTKSITISGTYSPNITITGYGTISTMSASGTAVLSDTNGTEVIPNMWIWNGTAWVRAKHFYVWDGGSWVHCQSFLAWNGTSWATTK
jgi:hypothetical protein